MNGEPLSKEKEKTGKELWNEIEKDYHQTSCSRDFEQEERLEYLEKQKWVLSSSVRSAVEGLKVVYKNYSPNSKPYLDEIDFWFSIFKGD